MATEPGIERPAGGVVERRAPLNLPFQIASWRSKSRKLLTARRSKPAARAARRRLKKGATRRACRRRRGSPELGDVGAGPAGKLSRRHEAISRPAAKLDDLVDDSREVATSWRARDACTCRRK